MTDDTGKVIGSRWRFSTTHTFERHHNGQECEIVEVYSGQQYPYRVRFVDASGNVSELTALDRELLPREGAASEGAT